MDTTVTHNEPTTPPAVVEARQYADGWTRLAAFLEDHPEIAEHSGADRSISRVLCYLGHRVEEPARFMADAAQACVDAGGQVESDARGEFAGVKLIFGPVHIWAYADAHRVATRRVTGVVEKVEYALTFDLPEQAVEGAEGAR